MMSRRLLRLLGWGGLLLAVGLAYAAFVSATGLFIPCIFRRLTGLLCPGCGVSHLCLALLELDIPGAWAANPGLFLLLPPLGIFFLRRAVGYVRRGAAPLSRGEGVLLWLMVAWLLVWGVLRNVM